MLKVINNPKNIKLPNVLKEKLSQKAIITEKKRVRVIPLNAKKVHVNIGKGNSIEYFFMCRLKYQKFINSE